jgi:hypothetical protein
MVRAGTANHPADRARLCVDNAAHRDDLGRTFARRRNKLHDARDG